MDERRKDAIQAVRYLIASARTSVDPVAVDGAVEGFDWLLAENRQLRKALERVVATEDDMEAAVRGQRPSPVDLDPAFKAAREALTLTNQSLHSRTAGEKQ